MKVYFLMEYMWDLKWICFVISDGSRGFVEHFIIVEAGQVP